MKTTNLIRCALGAAILAVFGLVGCEKLDSYSIDAPSDLQHRIDSIAASKPNTGDTTYLTIATAIVGAEDNSAAWWTAFSDYFTIPANKLLHMEFVNHTSGANNWNNWNLAVVNVTAHSTTDNANYAEYFVLRSDAYGWGNSDYNGKMITNNYPDTNKRKKRLTLVSTSVCSTISWNLLSTGIRQQQKTFFMVSKFQPKLVLTTQV